MTNTKEAFFPDKSNLSVITLAVFFGLFAVAAETIFDLPMKLPGHRAFPGALALLMFAEAFAPVILVGLAALISAILVIAGDASPLTMALWISAATTIFALGRSRLAHSILFFILGGVLFGGLRYLILSHGFHHTPELIRLGGHLGFGALAGLVSYGTNRLLGRQRSNS